jgi:bis(5'-nucleosyl)-tetraphosphatase (symmetrical)
MATYAIGDIQGCFGQLQRLLILIAFNPAQDRLWLVGDLVNRGPDSLDVLRWAYQHRDVITAVLGNHDLHALAVAAGIRSVKPKDTVDDLMTAPDRDELLAWLRHRPVLHCSGGFTMVHAGLLPAWTLEDAARYARELEAALRGPGYPAVLEAVYAGGPENPDETSDPVLRTAALANVFTRLRVCARDGTPRYDFAGSLRQIPEDRQPWFAFPGRRSAAGKIIFGHWAALGLHVAPGLFALDSGCVWGGALTALRLDDEGILQVLCSQQGIQPEPAEADQSGRSLGPG